MPWKEYPYRCALDNDGEGVSCDTEYIPVSLVNGTDTFRTEGLIDSGCDLTLASVEIAEYLKIDLTGLPTVYVRGIGGIGEGRKSSVSLHVDDLGESFTCPIVFMRHFDIPVALGQRDFFERFNVRFEKHQSKFFVQRIA